MQCSPGYDFTKRGTPHDIFEVFRLSVTSARVFLNGQVLAEEDAHLVEAGNIDAAVFGAPWIVNQDLTRRIVRATPRTCPRLRHWLRGPPHRGRRRRQVGRRRCSGVPGNACTAGPSRGTDSAPKTTRGTSSTTPPPPSKSRTSACVMHTRSRPRRSASARSTSKCGGTATGTRCLRAKYSSCASGASGGGARRRGERW